MKKTPAFILRNCALWLGDDAKVGQASEMAIPAMKLLTEKMRNAGMVMDTEVVMGFEKADATFKMAGVDPATLGLLGQADTRLMVRGALVDEDGATNRAECVMTGFLAETDLGTWSPGQRADASHVFKWSTLDLEVAGAKVLELTPYAVKVNGASVLADTASVLGI